MKKILCDLKEFNEINQYYFQEPGKALRVILIDLISKELIKYSAGENGNLKEKCEDWAGCLEILHVASLIHDDIVDIGEFRRV